MVCLFCCGVSCLFRQSLKTTVATTCKIPLQSNELRRDLITDLWSAAAVWKSRPSETAQTARPMADQNFENSGNPSDHLTTRSLIVQAINQASSPSPLKLSIQRQSCKDSARFQKYSGLKIRIIQFSFHPALAAAVSGVTILITQQFVRLLRKIE